MAVKGTCNCGNITVEIPAMPEGSYVCYCFNCQKSSAGACSVNYPIDKSSVKIEDPNGFLKSYKDSNTRSGRTITRQFCGNCGSPVVTLLAGDAPTVFLKGGLFEQAPPPTGEGFLDRKASWLKVDVKS